MAQPIEAAVADGKVFIGTVDARLIALNAKTGVKEWEIGRASCRERV